MELKHLTNRASVVLPVLDITVLDGETFEDAIVRIKKAQQQALEANQETEECAR
jgi:hypothetical protein